MTHKECNPAMVGENSNQGGLHLHEWEDQMGLSQSDLRSLPKSIQAVQSPDSRRVLSGLRVQSQIRHSLAQRTNTAKAQDDRTQGASAGLWCQGDLSADGDLGSRRLSVLGAAQSPVAVVASVGDQALGAVGPSAKATADDQPGNDRPATEGKETPTQKTTLRSHQARHLASNTTSRSRPTPGMSKPQGLPRSIWCRTRATRLQASFCIRSTSPTFTPPGWKAVR